MIIKKILLFPFAIIYFLVTELRNSFYNKKILKSFSFKIPIIGIGNLSIGGTGKTPMAEYIFDNFSKDYKLALLSRGYNRSTKGFKLADQNSDAKTIGDEPLQIFKKFKKIIVGVDENRVRGVKKLLEIDGNLKSIILDDCFQHRKISPKLSILLTTYNEPFFRDHILPIGTLRESSKGYLRADLIVVTKCPSKLKSEKIESFKKQINLKGFQKIFFTSISYSKNLSGTKHIEINDLQSEKILLVTGIANSKPLLNYLADQKINFFHLEFPDHYKYSKKDIDKIHKEFDKACILTTEKDYFKIKSLKINNSLYFIRMKIEFLNNSEPSFKKIIKKQININ